MLTRSENILSGTLSEVYARANMDLGEEYFTVPPIPDSHFGHCFLGIYRLPNDEIISALYTNCDALEDDGADVGEMAFDNLRMLVRARLETQQ